MSLSFSFSNIPATAGWVVVVCCVVLKANVSVKTPETGDTETGEERRVNESGTNIDRGWISISGPTTTTATASVCHYAMAMATSGCVVLLVSAVFYKWGLYDTAFCLSSLPLPGTRGSCCLDLASFLDTPWPPQSWLLTTNLHTNNYLPPTWFATSLII